MEGSRDIGALEGKDIGGFDRELGIFEDLHGLVDVADNHPHDTVGFGFCHAEGGYVDIILASNSGQFFQPADVVL